MKINEVLIDNINGAGQTPNNEEIDYLGLRVMMKPSVFKQLAEYASRVDLRNVDGLKDHIRNGGSIGAPFLIIRIPYSWESGDFSQAAVVVKHEGRNRMTAVLDLEGDIPVETHLTFGSRHRNRHITPEFIQHMQMALYPEGARVDKDGMIPSHLVRIYKPVRGPLFTM